MPKAKRKVRQVRAVKTRPAAANKAMWGSYSHMLIGGAVVAVVLAALGYMGTDIWLASTQWLIVAAVLAVLGVYAKMGW